MGRSCALLQMPPQHKQPNLQAMYLWRVLLQGYMPGQLYNLSSAYGNEQQLIELNEALKAAGIAPLADIVINHR
jgi:glycosidase